MFSNKNYMWVVVVVFVVIVLSGCSVLRAPARAAAEHDKLVTLYNGAVTSQSTYGACVDSAVAKINLIQGTYNAYLQTESDRVSAWRGEVNTATEEFNQRRSAYSDLNNTDIVSLNQMVEEEATPADLATGFGIVIDAYAPTEAILPTLPTEVVQQVIAEQSEASNLMLGCVVDWNQAAEAYNTERSRINRLSDSGRIIGDAANALGLSELPNRLPLYTSTSSSEPIPSFNSE